MLIVEYVTVEEVRTIIEAVRYNANAIPEQVSVIVTESGGVLGQRFYTGEQDGEDVPFELSRRIVCSIPNMPRQAKIVSEVDGMVIMPAAHGWFVNGLGIGEHEYAPLDEEVAVVA